MRLLIVCLLAFMTAVIFAQKRADESVSVRDMVGGEVNI